MKKTIAALIALFLFSITYMTGESAGSSTVTGDCQENAPGAANSSDTDSVKRNGYKLFPIEAPKRYEIKPNRRNELPEDNSLAESLRMLLGLGVSDNSNCPRKPNDRGLFKDY